MQEEQNSMKSEVYEHVLGKMLRQTEYIEHLMLPNQSIQDLQTNAYQFIMGPQGDNTMQRKTNKLRKYQIELIPQIWQLQIICIQLFYFTFACLSKNYCIVLQDRALVFKLSNKKFMLVIKNVQQNNQIHKNAFQFYAKTINFILSVVQHELNLLQKTMSDGRSKIQMFSQNQSLLTLTSITSQQIDNMLKPLRNFVRNIQEVFNSEVNQNSKNCFIELEKSEFIRRNSVLYQIRNVSINVILFMHSKPQSTHKLKTAIQKQKNLVNQFKQMQKVGCYTEHQLDTQIRKISTNFEKYVQQSWVSNPAYIKVVQKGIINQEQNNNNADHKFSFKIKVRYLNDKFMQSKMNGQKQMPKPANKQQTNSPEQTLEYTIEFDYSRCVICVCLLTSIQIEYFNIDQLLQSWNLLVFQSNSIELQVREKVEMLAKKKKCLVFKTTLNFQRGSSLLALCLKTIDSTFAGYRVLQHIFGQRSAGNSKWKVELQQFDSIGKQINHYISLISELSRKLYYSA